MNEALQALEVKVENGGATPQGKFFAKDWNTLVEAVKALDLKEFDDAALLKFLKDNGYITSDELPEVDLSSVVTLGTEQAITGEKNFVGGVKINGVPFVYNAEIDAWVLEGNLLVTKGVAWFASIDGFEPSTIMDAVQVDGETIVKNELGQLKVIGGGSGGSGGGLTISDLSNYLTTNKYTKQSDVETLISTALTPYALTSAIPTNNSQLTNGAGYITSSALKGYATESWVTNKGYITASALTGYATEQWVGDNYLASSNFTKANIKSTLGISDWALAATKPSYTAAEVGALSTSGDTISGSLSLKETNSIILRPSLYTHYSGIGYDTKGDECIAIWARNAATRLRWHAGINLKDGVTIGSMMDITPDFEVSKASGVAVGYIGGNTLIHSGNIGSYNAGSATKLQTARTIWGRSFDGSGNVDGDIYMGGATVLHTDDSDTWLNYGGANDGKSLRLCGKEVIFQYGRGDAFTRAMTITNGSNVAIGRTTADAKLHVGGDLITDGDLKIGNYKGLLMSKYGTQDFLNAMYISGNNGALVIGNDVASWGYSTYLSGNTLHLRYGTALTEGIRIDNNGLISIFGDIDGGSFFLRRSNATNPLLRLTVGSQNYYVQATSDGVYLGSTSAVSLKVAANGDTTINGNLFVNGNVSWVSQSQRSLKNIISEQGLSLAQLERIKPIKFYWKDGRDAALHVGGVADVFAEVLPEVVSHWKNTLCLNYVDAGFYVGASLIAPVLDHERRITEGERERKALKMENATLKRELAIMKQMLNQLAA